MTVTFADPDYPAAATRKSAMLAVRRCTEMNSATMSVVK
jgi:hypothetical protein